MAATSEYSFITPSEQAPPGAGGIAGGPGYDRHGIFYVGVTNVAETLASAEALGARPFSRHNATTMDSYGVRRCRS